MLRLSLKGLLFLSLFAGVLVAQSAKPTQRTFPVPKPQVENALRQLAGSSGGKLPILVGFAVPGDHSLERFRQGYYEYEIAVTPINARETAVQVTAKITAWYAGEKPEESNYEVLGSNGRLESDLLDRLADALKSGQSPVQQLEPAGTDAHRAPDPRPDAPSTAKVNYLSRYLRQASPKAEATGGQPTPAPAEAVTDQQISKLTREEAALAQIKSSQARPTDLAVVKAPKTPVMSRPSKDAQVVLVAEADDELQVLDANNDWVHVHLIGLSRGWVRRSQLDLSNVSLPATATKQAAATSSQDQPFQKTREETGTFPGEWKALQGKKVDIVWLQERDEASPPSESGEMRYFESLMRKQYAALTAEHNEAEGVVLVLDSASGGMIASTNSALQRWTAGSLSSNSFWRECWFDPPDIFQSLRQGK